MGISLEVLKNLFTKPFTRKYPKEKAEVGPKFRGKIKFYSRKCIGCRLCYDNCPPNAIKFIRKGRINFDMGKCIYCGYCRDVCPTKAIAFVTDFEFSTNKKRKLVIR